MSNEKISRTIASTVGANEWPDISTEELLAGSHYAALSNEARDALMVSMSHISTDDLIASSYAGRHGLIMGAPKPSPAQMAKAVAKAIVEGTNLPDHYGLTMEHQSWIEGMIVNPNLAYAVDGVSEHAVALHMAREEIVAGLHRMPPNGYMDEFAEEEDETEEDDSVMKFG